MLRAAGHISGGGAGQWVIPTDAAHMQTGASLSMGAP
jgi:hypothetical protein